MLLNIDCGNTNTVFAIWDGARFCATWRISTNHQRTADEYFVWLSALMNLAGLHPHIEGVIISSTVPRVVLICACSATAISTVARLWLANLIASCPWSRGWIWAPPLGQIGW